MLNHDVRISKDGIISFDYKDALVVAKKTGLRSKKKRHVIKRFKRIVNLSLIMFIWDADNETR